MRFPEVSFVIPSGEERFRDRLLEKFPHEGAAVRKYFDDLRHICSGFAFHRADQVPDMQHADHWMRRTAGDYFRELTSDENLRAVLLSQNPLYGVEPRRTPMGMHALVTDSFMLNPYTVDGGGDAIATAMVDRIRELGGDVKTRRRVTAIDVSSERHVTGVRTEKGETFRAPLIVSCAHPKITMGLLPEEATPPGYRRRIMAMEDGVATLSIFITTRADLGSYGGKNIYLYNTRDIDSIYDRADGKHDFVFATVPTAREGKAKNGVHQAIGIGLMKYRNVEKWAGTKTAERGTEYEEYKAEQTEQLVELMSQAIPELRGRVESVEAATPLTNRDYAGSVGGAAYGLHHTPEQTGRYGLRPRTKVHGLYMCGQSVLMPGLFGVTISAFYTCSLILGGEYLMKKVNGQ